MSEHPRVIRFADVEQTFGRADGGAVTALDGITFDLGATNSLPCWVHPAAASRRCYV
jgi:hypothetical protein